LPEELPVGLTEALNEALAQLPETDQEIVRMRYLGPELSFAEIAGRLNMQEGTVRVRHHRVLARLQRLMTDHAAIQDWLGRGRRPAPALEDKTDE
jgi:DNA-directed RNA polymerase specialized sigma24 family protein